MSAIRTTPQWPLVAGNSLMSTGCRNEGQAATQIGISHLMKAATQSSARTGALGSRAPAASSVSARV